MIHFSILPNVLQHIRDSELYQKYSTYTIGGSLVRMILFHALESRKERIRNKLTADLCEVIFGS